MQMKNKHFLQEFVEKLKVMDWVSQIASTS